MPAETWWRTWAPYWERLEDRHLGTFVTETFTDGLSGPVLVVGSGQGLVVEHLRKKGFSVIGADLEREMISLSMARRNTRGILADAAHLPFDDGAFGTVVIATGVVDYLEDEAEIGAILTEARRVARNRGEIVIAFYRLPPRIEAINRRLGVISKDGKYRLRRIFDIMRSYEEHFMAPAKQIAKWTGKGRASTMLYWLSLGATLPSSMRREQHVIKEIFELAEKDGVNAESLCSAAPEELPYRDEGQIRRLMERVGASSCTLDSHPDCIVARFQRFDAPFTAHAGSEGDAVSSWVIRTRDLRKVYRKNRCTAVDKVSMTVERGSVFGILGPNGAGKTTTLSMLTGLVRPTSGAVEFAADILKRGEPPLGYVPQELALYARLTARDNLAFFGRLHGLSGRRLKRRIEETLSLTGLSHRADEAVSQFSQGMMRRLNLAVGLLHEPDLVLLDEPTVGIDPQSRNRIHDAIFELKNRGATVLYTTHYMEEAMKLCDRIAIMDHGKVILNERPREAVSRYGSFRIELEIKGGKAPALARALKSIRSVRSAEIEGDRIIVSASADEESKVVIAAVEEAARGCGAALVLRSVAEPSLESLFLDITGRSLRDVGGA